MYQLRDDAQLVSEAGLRSMITPDQWCAYWSMLAGGAASLCGTANICAVSPFFHTKCRPGPVPYCGAPTFTCLGIRLCPKLFQSVALGDEAQSKHSFVTLDLMC